MLDDALAKADEGKDPAAGGPGAGHARALRDDPALVS